MISVIVPVYNEEKVIAIMLRDLLKVLRESFEEYEVIVVNDGSTDGSAEIIEKEKNSAVRVVTHPENLGYGKSLLDGAIASRYECIAIIDADGSYLSSDIKRLYEYYPQYDMIVGARHGKEYKRGLFKKPARMFFKCLVEYASGRKIEDVNSGLRIFKKSILMKFENSLCSGFSFTTTCTLIFMLNYYYVKYLPISYEEREGRSKVRYLRDTLRAGQIIVSAILYYNPVKLFILIATVNFILGITVGLINHFFLRMGFLSIAAAVCIASFFPVFCIGLIADQLRRINKINN